MDSPGHENIVHTKSQHQHHLQSITVALSLNTKISGETARGDEGDFASSLQKKKFEENMRFFEQKESGRNLNVHDPMQSPQTDKNRVEHLQTMVQTGGVEEAAGHQSENNCRPLGRNMNLENNSTKESEHAADMDVDHEGKPPASHPDNFQAQRGPAACVTETPESITDQNLMKNQISRRNVETNSDDLASRQLRAQEHGKPEEESHRQLRSKGCNPQAQSTPKGNAKAVVVGPMARHEKLGNAMLKEESHTAVDKNIIKDPATQKHRKEVQEQSMMRAPTNEMEKLRYDNYFLHHELQRAGLYIREMESSEQKYKQKLSYQHRLLQQLEQDKYSLGQQIEKFELQNAQQSVAETGSYEDLTATPPLLQTAVDAVKEAVGIFASDLFKVMRNHAINVNSSHPDLGTEMKPAQTKIVLQSEICTAFFTSFENQAFGIPTATLSFARPKEQKQKFFKLYQDLRYTDLPQIYKQDDFHQFLDMKRGNLLNQTESSVFTDARQRGQFLSNIIDEEQTTIYGSFVRLGKAIWVLHKLACAFEPTAEIFRVTKNSLFDEDYMKKISQDDDDDDDEGANMREVAFMVVPGFTVRNTVVKAHVCLKPPPPPPPKSFLSMIRSSFS